MGEQVDVVLMTKEDREANGFGIRMAGPVEAKRKNERRQDGGYAWVILLASFLLNFTADGVSYAFGIFLSKISADFPEAGKSGTAWIASFMTAVTHAAGPIGSMLINKFGWRWISLLGSLLAGGGFVASYWTPNIFTMYGTIGVVAGFGFTLLYLVSMLPIPEYFTEKRSFATGVTVSGSGIGTFALSWIFGIILSIYTWREGLLIVGIYILATSALAFIYPSSSQKSKTVDPEIPANSLEVEPKSKKLFDLTLFRNIPFIIFLLADFVTTMGFHVPYVYLPEIEHELTSTDSNSIMIMMTGAIILSRIFFGYLSDRKWVNRIYLYAILLALAGLLTVESSQLNSLGWLRAVWTLYGICMGVTALKTVIMVDLVGLEKLTDALGLLLFFEAAGFLIGAPLVGFVYDHYGSYTYGFYFVGGMVIISAIMVCCIPRLSQYSENSSKVKEETGDPN